MFFSQFLGSDKHVICWLGPGILTFRHSFQAPVWRRWRASPAREVAGEGCDSPGPPLHGFARAILAAAPWNMGEGVSDLQILPAVRRWGLAFPLQGRACGLEDAPRHRAD